MEELCADGRTMCRWKKNYVADGRTMCHTGTDSARPSITPSSEPQWGLTLIELLRPYYLGYNRRSRSDGKKLSIPSTSRTLAARRGAPSTNLLTSHLCPVSANSIASQLMKNGAHRTGGRESNRFVNKELFDLCKIPTPEGHSISDLSSRKCWLLPSDA